MSEGLFYVILFVLFCASLHILKAAAKNDKKKPAAPAKSSKPAADVCSFLEHPEAPSSSDDIEKLLADNAEAIHAPETADLFGNNEAQPKEVPKAIDYSVPAVFRKKRLLVV